MSDGPRVVSSSTAPQKTPEQTVGTLHGLIWVDKKTTVSERPKALFVVVPTDRENIVGSGRNVTLDLVPFYDLSKFSKEIREAVWAELAQA